MCDYTHTTSTLSNREPEEIKLDFGLISSIFATDVNNVPKKSMSIIREAFKSKENKALEYFGLGSLKELNEKGKSEFVQFIYETGKTDAREFVKKIVECYNKAIEK